MYTIHKALDVPALDGELNSGLWQQAETLRIEHFHPRGSGHRPGAEARMLYDDSAIHLIFQVRDRYVRCVHTGYQSAVWKDSCVEFFVAPRPGIGRYFNIEVNCGGGLCLQYGPPRAEGQRDILSAELGKKVAIYHSMPEVVDPEIAKPTDWIVQLRIDLALFGEVEGPVGPLAGQEWKANFYKCADECSHPHWASWSPVGDPLDFHRPETFAPIRFTE